MSNAAVLLTNRSSRMRVGCKGPNAEAWLAEHGITVPPGANRFAVDPRGLLSARLATSEFLFEATDSGSDPALALARRTLDLAQMPSGVYPVLRQDFVLELSGPRAHDLFAQTCAVDLTAVERESTATEGPIVMTSMIGVGTVIACRAAADGPRFTLWCDPSYGDYFWHQLLTIATDLGGEGTHP